jgi:hypothetical protein
MCMNTRISKMKPAAAELLLSCGSSASTTSGRRRRPSRRLLICGRHRPRPRWWSFVTILAAAFIIASISGAAGQGKARNPFNVEDVPDPDGEDVKAFAAKIALPGAANDPNAVQWAEKATSGTANSLDGEWSSRWNRNRAPEDWFTGTAKVKSVGDRVYIYYKDRTNEYLIDARREGKTRLVGRYLNLGEHTDTTPWVGVIIDDERIDGIWTLGRWDLRRSLASEK